MKRVFSGLFGAGSLLCIGLLTTVAGSSAEVQKPNPQQMPIVYGNKGSPRAHDVPAAKRSLVSAITFPTTGFYYSADVWNRGFPGARGEEAGCGTPAGNSAGDICGTAGDASSVARVQVSVKRGSGASGKYWDGFAFRGNAEVFTTADGTSKWNLNFGFDRFAPGIYTVHVRATDIAGNSESGSIRVFSVSPDYAVIPVISSMEVIGEGSHPAFRKLPSMVDLKVFDKAEFRIGNDGEEEPMSYASIWERTANSMALVPATSQLLNGEGSVPPLAALSCQGFDQDGSGDDNDRRDCGVKIQYGNDDAYLYEIMVPSNTNANRAAFGISGSYLVIGKAIVCLKGSDSSDAGADGQCAANGGIAAPVYTGANVYSVQSGRLLSEKHLHVTVDGNGKIHSMMSRPVEGTPLVISVPTYMDFTGATELVPIVYESVDGDWQAKISIAPPQGFAADMTSVELQAGIGDTDVVQITVTGVSTGSSITGITHVITYKGKTIDVPMILKTN